MIRAPSRGTSDRPNSRWTGEWAYRRAGPPSEPARPRDTSPRDCRHAAINTDWSLRQGDCAAWDCSASVRMPANITEVLSMSDPKSAAELPALRLKRNEDRRLHAGHLWIFSNEVDTQQTPLPKFQPGELGGVLAHNPRALGLAYVNPQSLISPRMLETWQIPDAAWLARRIRTALRLRERLYSKPYYRLVYGESDGLPGLVVDRYGAACVVQIGTA